MNKCPTTLSISALERETGLSKDQLRKWEDRYGFPQPMRLPQGGRFYTSSDLARLLIIKRLLDQGHRPAQVVGLDLAALQCLADKASAPVPHQTHDKLLGDVWQALQTPSALALKSHLDRAIKTHGLRIFVQDIVPRLHQMVGDGWASGRLAVHQEHLYSETIRALLVEAQSPLQPLADHPRIVLATPAGERHDLGILMVHAMLALDGMHCIWLGADMPFNELVAAAQFHQARALALSLSLAFPTRKIIPMLEQIRAGLGPEIDIWAGGAGISRLRRELPGVRTFQTLDSASTFAATYLRT